MLEVSVIVVYLQYVTGCFMFRSCCVRCVCWPWEAPATQIKTISEMLREQHGPTLLYEFSLRPHGPGFDFPTWYEANTLVSAQGLVILVFTGTHDDLCCVASNVPAIDKTVYTSTDVAQWWGFLLLCFKLKDVIYLLRLAGHGHRSTKGIILILLVSVVSCLKPLVQVYSVPYGQEVLRQAYRHVRGHLYFQIEIETKWLLKTCVCTTRLVYCI